MGLRASLSGAIAVALLGSLCAPAAWVRYAPCCYDAQGHLRAGQPGCCGKPRTSGPGEALYAHRPCCDPTVFLLRGSSTIQAEAVASPDQQPEPLGVLPQAAGAAAIAGSGAQASPALAIRGPPHAEGLLHLLSRLNI